VAPLIICHLHKVLNLPSYTGTMTRNHILTIIDRYNHWPVEAIMTCADRPPPSVVSYASTVTLTLTSAA
jgi:hypothetical protein